jgi:hypothetical protein
MAPVEIEARRRYPRYEGQVTAQVSGGKTKVLLFLGLVPPVEKGARIPFYLKAVQEMQAGPEQHHYPE